MKYFTKLDQLMNTNLPLNRKERFFTGTVCPMIVCRDNFKYFNKFTELIPDCGKLNIKTGPEDINFQFFTEYSIKESLIGKEKKRFPGLPSTKDTPDIIIFVDGEVKTLIVLEAKMYDSPAKEKLKKQIKNQKVIIKCIR